MPRLKRDLTAFRIVFLQSLFLIMLVTFLSGCGAGLLSEGGGFPFFQGTANRSVSGVLTPNPASVIITDQEFVWNQIIDELDDYFKIQQEERIRLEDGIVTEGLIQTYPTPGSTLLEPWRHDSTPGFEKWYATFQTIRRWAKVKVIPAGTTFLIDVQVYKEMEDLQRPENAAVGSIRTNITPNVDRDGALYSLSGTQKWYSVGRDTSLEQRILSRILARLQK